MKKVLLIIAVVIIIVVGYCVWERYSEEEGALEVVAPVVLEGTDDGGTNEDVSSLTILRVKLAGWWVSVDDSKYEVEQSADGTLKEYYDGSQMSAGSWILSEEPPEGLVFSEGAAFTGTYLTKELDGEESYYGILIFSDPDFSMIYFDRGSTLSFTRKIIVD